MWEHLALLGGGVKSSARDLERMRGGVFTKVRCRACVPGGFGRGSAGLRARGPERRHVLWPSLQERRPVRLEPLPDDAAERAPGFAFPPGGR